MDELNNKIQKNDIEMTSQNLEEQNKLGKKKLQEEFLKFLKSNTVYETIPENMKVILNNLLKLL